MYTCINDVINEALDLVSSTTLLKPLTVLKLVIEILQNTGFIYKQVSFRIDTTDANERHKC